MVRVVASSPRSHAGERAEKRGRSKKKKKRLIKDDWMKRRSTGLGDLRDPCGIENVRVAKLIPYARLSKGECQSSTAPSLSGPLLFCGIIINNNKINNNNNRNNNNCYYFIIIK